MLPRRPELSTEPDADLPSRGRDAHDGPVNTEVPVLRTWSDLLAAGYTAAEVQRWRRAGRIAPIRRGVYADPSGPGPGRPEARHVLDVRAAARRLAAGSVMSHVSAAVLHGLPVWGVAMDRVHVTRDGTGGGRINRGLHRHVAPLPPSEVVVIDGVPVTSVARTIVDLGRTTTFEQAVVIADAALRARTDPAQLTAAVARASGWPGAPAAARVVSFADGRSESVGESRSRVAIVRAGLPAPELQWVIRSGGRFVARSDFGWPERATVGEFDGRVKYGRELREDRDAGEVVFLEKRREDEIRALDLFVVRWIWADLDHFEPVAARLARRLTHPDRRDAPRML